MLNSGSGKLQEGSLSEGNGQPYDGKLASVFYQTLPNYNCESKPSPVATVKKMASGELLYTFNQNDKCAAINESLLDSSKVENSSYNPNFVGYRDHIFEKSESSPDLASSVYTEAWCKPSDNTNEERYDVVVKYDSASKITKAEIFSLVNNNNAGVPTFEINRMVTSDNLDYKASGFDLQIDRSAPAPAAWWFFPGYLLARIGSKEIRQNVNCRVVAGKLLGIVKKTYPKNGLWNDYVRVTDLKKDRSNQPEIACDGSETKEVACLHGAEYVAVETTLRSCIGLTLEENLNAFNWECVNEPEGAKFYSRGLLQGRHLSDLLSFPNWKKNFVSIRKDGTIVYQSLPTTWWFNTLEAVPNNSISGLTNNLSGESHIFVVQNTQQSAGYILADNKQAFVVMPSAELQSSVNMPTGNCLVTSASSLNRCLVMIYSRKFTWVEGSFNNIAGGPADANVAINLSVFSRLDNIQSANAKNSGIYLRMSSRSIIKDFIVSQNLKYGIYSTFSESNLYWNGDTKENAKEGIHLNSWDNYNSVVGVSFHNNTQMGLTATASNDLFVLHSDAHSNGYGGFEIHNLGGLNQKFLSVLSRNNNWGFWISQTAKGLFSDVASINQVFSGLRVDGNSTTPSDHRFINNLMMGGNGASNCQIIPFAGSPGLIDGSCTDSGLDNTSTYAGQLSTASLRLGCTWNESARVVSCPSWTSVAAALVEGQNCPAEANGDQAIQDPQDATHFFLKAAVEIPNQERGNNNGLCESGESCLYLPGYLKIASNRGPGLSGACLFKNGVVSKVRLY